MPEHERRYPRSKVFATASCSFGRSFGESTSVDCQVLSVSEGGVMLRSSVDLPTGGPVHVRFMLSGAGLLVQSAAQVRWWRTTSDGKRDVGLQFESPHPGIAAYVERRSQARRGPRAS